MKEIIIFFIIVVLALAVFFTIDDPESMGANLLGSFGFGSVKPAVSKETAPKSSTSNQLGTDGQNIIRLDYSSMQPNFSQTQYPSQTPSNSKTGADKPENTSDYYQKVTISGLTKKSINYPSVIRLSVSTKEGINLTGFTIKTRHGQFKIPEGVEKYRGAKTEKNITVNGYMNIYIIEGSSPLITDAFRTNTCFGYLKENNEFYPSLYSYCPKPKIEDLYNLHPYCQDYILKIGNCQTPDYSKDLKIASNSYCTEYIRENLNYSGCYNNFNKEDNFLGNSWYIYTKSNIIEPLHDIIYLYDREGLLIDDYAY